MTSSPAFPARVGDAATRNAQPAAGRGIAIVDIGSNSVRLVVFEGLSRTAHTVHNEKTICSIGRDMAVTGALHRDGVETAIETLRRFRILTDRLGVAEREAVATAAARDAGNGAEFVRRAESAWGAPVRVLSGPEEARLAGEGVLAAIPDADGLVADLGGGSLDMVTVKGGRTGETASLPFGPLRLIEPGRSDLDRLRQTIDAEFARLPLLRGLEGRTLYVVGGVWRSLARVDMLEERYRLHMLQHYAIPCGRALDLCGVLAKQGRKSLELMTAVSRRRIELLPRGAMVLQRLLLQVRFKEVVVSANGVREGLLHEKLPPEERAKDPLIDFAAAENARHARAPEHAFEMFHWAMPLFADENADQRRLRLAASLFSDLGWRRHPDHRVRGTYLDVLYMPFGGADHRARAFIAAAVHFRYSGDDEIPSDLRLPGLVDKQDERRALRIGLAARLAFDLTGSAAGELPKYRLRLTPSKLQLEVPARRNAIADDTVGRRLATLSTALDRRPEILIVGG